MVLNYEFVVLVSNLVRYVKIAILGEHEEIGLKIVIVSERN